MPRSPIEPVRVMRVRADGGVRADDEVVVEEPLEIRIAGDTLAVTMRTPGHDRELVLGFLWAEGIVSSKDDVASVAYCGKTGDPGRENTIDVIAAAGAKLRLPEDGRARRGTLVTSACGVCGRRSIDDLLARCGPLPKTTVMTRSAIVRAVATLRETQPLFGRSGGCHGAGLFTKDGAHVATFEDVGRHNAVDKLVGSLVLAGKLPASGHALVVSGRTSFEIVQKAVAAGIPVIVGVSAPSSLAIDLAKSCGVTLVGFARADAFAVYAGDFAEG